MDIEQYENLSDDELLDKMADLDWDIIQKEHELAALRSLYNQAQQTVSRQETFAVVRQAHRK